MNFKIELRLLDLIFSVCFVTILADMIKNILMIFIPSVSVNISCTYQIAFVIIYVILIAGLYNYLKGHDLL